MTLRNTKYFHLNHYYYNKEKNTYGKSFFAFLANILLNHRNLVSFKGFWCLPRSARLEHLLVLLETFWICTSCQKTKRKSPVWRFTAKWMLLGVPLCFIAKERKKMKHCGYVKDWKRKSETEVEDCHSMERIPWIAQWVMGRHVEIVMEGCHGSHFRDSEGKMMPWEDNFQFGCRIKYLCQPALFKPMRCWTRTGTDWSRD